MKRGIYFDDVYPEHDLLFDGEAWWWIDLDFTWVKHSIYPCPNSLLGYELVMEF